MGLCRGLYIYMYIYMLNVDLGSPVVCPFLLMKDTLFGPRFQRIFLGCMWVRT